MKILKKNQLIILVLSLILMTAGYLNFTNQEEVKPSTEILGELGDATLVSSNVVYNTINENIAENNDSLNEMENISENNITNIENNSTETSNQPQEDTYFTTSKLERENIYSQMLETYQEIYNNVNSTAEQKKDALDKINEINNTRNSIMIAENLVKAKGFEDIVIFSNSNSISVIIKKDNLEAEEIAQIQNIVSRELNVGVDIINISTK